MPDVMSKEKRSALMSRIRGRNTWIERSMVTALRSKGIRFRRHVRLLPRCAPDFVIRESRLVLFLDGDFWHGWRFPLWKQKLSPFWRDKIAGNRARDQRNIRALRRRGWKVLRIWEHQLEADIDKVVEKLAQHCRQATPVRDMTGD